jgi:hypothetical protein
VSNLSFSAGTRVALSSQAHLPHVSTLSGPGTKPGIRPVIRETSGGGAGVNWSAFLLPFGRRHSLLGHPFQSGNSAPLTVGLPAPPTNLRASRTRTRFPCSARLRPGWEGCPLYSGDGGVHTTVAWSSVAACRLSTARSLKPWCSRPPQSLTMTKHQRGFTVVHPSSLPLACNPRTEREPSGLPLSFTPN